MMMDGRAHMIFLCVWGLYVDLLLLLCGCVRASYMEMSSHETERGESGRTALLESRRCAPGRGSIFIYVLAAVASIGGFLFGYDTGVVSGAMEIIKHDAVIVGHVNGTLTDMQHEAIVSSTTGFAALGAVLAGTANRRFGRKPVLLSAALIFTGGAVLMAIAHSFHVLLIGRCIVGLAVGLASSTVPMYLAELAPAPMRGLLVSLNNSCVVIGQVSAAAVDCAFAGDTTAGWRWMLGLGAVPSGLQFFGLVALPESPRWLLSRGREQQARKVLVSLRSGSAGSSADVDTIVEHEIEEIVTSLSLASGAPGCSENRSSGAHSSSSTKTHVADGETPAAAVATVAEPDSASAARESNDAPPADAGTGGSPVTLRDLWEVRRQLRLGVGLMCLQQLIGINTIMYYSVSILAQGDVGNMRDMICLNIPVAAAQLVGCAIGGVIIDRVGRRTLALASLMGAAISLAVEGAAFFLVDRYCGGDAPSPSPAHSGHNATASLGSLGSVGGTPLDAPAFCEYKGGLIVGG